MSKFENFLTETDWNYKRNPDLDKLKRPKSHWDEPDDSASNQWACIKDKADGKDFTIIKNFKTKKEADTMAANINKKYNTDKYSSLEVA